MKIELAQVVTVYYKPQNEKILVGQLLLKQR